MTGQQWVITVPCPGWWLTANNAVRDIHAQARRVKAWRDAAYWAACVAKPRKDCDQVQVDVLFRWTNPPVEEIENCRPTIKAVVDGAIGRKRGKGAGYGIVASDSDKRLKYGAYEQEIVQLPANRLAMFAHAGEVVLTVTDLSEVAHV